ncbi:putative xylosidase [Lophium mytilinum]|uniref:Putative xylosidase n=1 Tax=Lophium mytilinum TaxID=390894 RepID=A0A6A6QN14_9PEZI|nr:putative xylosidase [Lophium mytilinum]
MPLHSEVKPLFPQTQLPHLQNITPNFLPTMPPSPKPLISHIYTADPSAHVFNDRIYIYPSHDISTDIRDNDNGDQYAMTDYHVFSTPSLRSSSPPAVVTDHGPVLSLSQIPWAAKQLWAPDAAAKNGKYYLYFPARDMAGVFRIGVAVGEAPEGPFRAEPAPIPGSYSIDPAAFVDEDGAAYLYFGGVWGGQLQCWRGEDFNGDAYEEMEARGEEAALRPRVARLREDMLGFDEDGVREVEILMPDGTPVPAGDREKRFFEASWVHKRGGVYYFSYSTGDSHLLIYATGGSPLGPFTYRGVILRPVVGWTTHHSIVEFEGRWWLFYHDASLSGGVNHLRCVKVREIWYDAEGAIRLMDEQ